MKHSNKIPNIIAIAKKINQKSEKVDELRDFTEILRYENDPEEDSEEDLEEA